MAVKILNLNSVIKQLDNGMNIDIRPIIVKATHKVRNTAFDMSPYDTGQLRNSLMTEIIDEVINGKNSVVGRVFTSVEYAPFQEYGTYKMKAHPFMKPALDKERAGIKKELVAFYRSELAKI